MVGVVAEQKNNYKKDVLRIIVEVHSRKIGLDADFAEIDCSKEFFEFQETFLITNDLN